MLATRARINGNRNMHARPLGGPGRYSEEDPASSKAWFNRRERVGLMSSLDMFLYVNSTTSLGKLKKQATRVPEPVHLKNKY